jgi:uncharacterized protein DUF3617
MKKMILLGAVCLSATVMLAQTQKKNTDQEPVKTGVKMTPMNVKTGLWQSTSTITIIGGLGLPPEVLAKMSDEQKARYAAAMQAQSGGHSSTHTNKGCLTQKDLTTDPFAQKNSDDENIHCHGTLLSSTSTDIVLRETCTGEASMTYTMKIHAVDQEHATGTGTGTATMGGHTMNSSVKFDSKWIGATCPAGTNHD